MHDTFLFKKISDSLFEMCKESNIKKITYLEVDVNYHSHVNSKTLLSHLLLNIPELIDIDTNIIVNKGETEKLTAVIKKIEGIDDETVCS